ncbi:hypothetical protein V8E36_006991 [Tilletia maclaganii]
MDARRTGRQTRSLTLLLLLPPAACGSGTAIRADDTSPSLQTEVSRMKLMIRSSCTASVYHAKVLPAPPARARTSCSFHPCHMPAAGGPGPTGPLRPHLLHIS